MPTLPRPRTLLPGVAFLVLAAGFSVNCDVDPCGATPESFAARAQDFFAQVEAADHDASAPEWDRYDERFRELVEACYPRHEEALTREQDRAFWAGVTDYYVKRYGRAGAREALRKLRGGLDGALRDVEGWLDRNL